MKYYLFGIAIILLLATGPVLALDIREIFIMNWLSKAFVPRAS